MISIKRGSRWTAALLLLSVLLTFGAKATDILFNVNAVFGTQPPYDTNRVFKIQSLSPFAGNFFWRTSDVSGNFWVSNALATTYSGQMLAPPNSLTFSFFVSATNLGTIPAQGITSIPANGVNSFPAGQTAYSAQASDTRYAPIGSGPFSALTAPQSTNLVQNSTNALLQAITNSSDFNVIRVDNLILPFGNSLMKANASSNAIAAVSGVDYDAAGAALAATNGIQSIAYSNFLSFATTNTLAFTSNALQSQIGSAGISASTATNIAAFQASAATNAAGISSGLAAYVSTNRFIGSNNVTLFGATNLAENTISGQTLPDIVTGIGQVNYAGPHLVTNTLVYGFTNLDIGDNIVGSWNSQPVQLVVGWVPNGSNAYVFEQIQNTFSGQPNYINAPGNFQIYKNALKFWDINGQFPDYTNHGHGGIDGNGGMFVLTGENVPGWGYGYQFFDQTNMYRFTTAHEGTFGPGVEMEVGGFNTGDPFFISGYAHYLSLVIRSNSYVNLWSGITNQFGDLGIGASGNVTFGGPAIFSSSIAGNAASLTNLSVSSVSTNGSAANQVITSIGGVAVWTNVTAVAGAGITNALGTNFPNGKLINQTLFYPTNDLSITSNSLVAQIAVKADTNTPTIYTPNISGGNINGFTNNNNIYFFNSGGGYIGGQTIASLSIAPAGGGGLLAVLGNLSATNATFRGTIVGNGSGITNAGSTNIMGTGLIQVTNIATSILSSSNANYMLGTNGYSTGQQATNLSTFGDMAFGKTGQATNILGSSTNYVYFVGAGSLPTTNGALIWTSSLNCYTNWLNGSILTNSGSAWLYQTNGVTLYSIAGSSPVGAYSAISGAAPAPSAYYTAAINDHMVFLGYWSVSNQYAISNAIITNVTGFANSNFIANLNGFGTNGRGYNTRLISGDGLERDNANNFQGQQIDFSSAAFGQANTNIASGFGAAILSGATNRITADGASIIAGGTFNTINGGSGNADVIVGGAYNTLTGSAGISSVDANFIGGGMSNKINTTAIFSFLGGGLNNAINGGGYAVLIGGAGNTNSQDGAVTLGGATNKNNGHWGLVGGRNVTVNHDNVFSWSDGIADTSVTNSQHRITATNGMVLNGPLWLGGSSTNSGTYYLSNSTPFNIWAVTNSMPNFAYWRGQSNGILVTIYYSNSVSYMRNDWP